MTPDNIDQLDPRQYILIKGAKVNNLKKLDVAIPRNKLVVITGVSGSGKSSLAFDTLYAEGQRMYVESLSSYARQFLGRMEKPEVEYIKGVSPAIAIEQKVNTKNPRSTIGTTTEIYDYLKLLFARIGKTYSPVSGKEVKKHDVDDVLKHILAFSNGQKFLITSPLIQRHDRSIEDELKVLLAKGYTRVMLTNEETWFIEDLLKKEALVVNDIEIIIDRGAVKHGDEDFTFRFSDSIQTAFFEGEGRCFVRSDDSVNVFSDSFEMDGIVFEEPTVNLFSFNNPYGACRRCEGFGKILGIDPGLVIPDESMSLYEGCVAPWRGETMKLWQNNFISDTLDYDFPIHRPYKELESKYRTLLWEGNKKVNGINNFFSHIESKLHKIQYRVMLSRYRGRTECPECRGTRIRKDASFVKINDYSITDLVLKPVSELSKVFDNLKIPEAEQKIAKRLLSEISSRVSYLKDVGLSYLNLNRLTSTLSGGEYQRVKLSTSLGSALVGSMYILDEPSIGLHPRDTLRLVGILKHLRDLGNTVIVVEHEEEIMRAADQIIDIGPDAGINGGNLVFQGNLEDINGAQTSYTTKFLKGELALPLNESPRHWNEHVLLEGAQLHNLKNIKVKFPLGVFTAITGVSGSGKSTLINELLTPNLKRKLEGIDLNTKTASIDGNWKKVTQVEFIDQNPIGKSSRSNPVTYVKAYDAIRALFTDQEIAKSRAYKASHFSFNVDGGRCENCQGEGTIKIEMQFMADIEMTCEVCDGKRFKDDILEVKVNDKNIADILDLTIDEAMSFFDGNRAIINKLKPLQDVGLGYIKLGQSSNTLSGGEAQRVKLASFLAKNIASDRIMFIFDEPTTGLHFHDIRKLLDSLQALVEQGHTIIVIEHNLDLIQCADWIIDLGPEGGDNGGEIVFEGTPNEMIKKGKGHTSEFLKRKYD